MEWEENAKKAWKVVFLLILVALLLGILTWTKIVRCGVIPGWCDVYYGVKNYAYGGQPRVAIVYGEDGFGEPELLQEILGDPQILGVRADMIGIENVEIGNIRDYDLVIVERARTMETKKLDVFVEYVTKYQGNLVWTGDAGTLMDPDDRVLYQQQRDNLVICEDIMRKKKLTAEEIIRQNLDCIWAKDADVIGPWARVRDDDTIINFDQVLGVQYYGNFCELVSATPEQTARCFAEKRIVGALLPEEKNPLVVGLRPDLPMHGDFAVVDEISSGTNSTRALSVKFDGKIVVRRANGKNVSLGNILPIIQTSGFGGKVAYYANPPEQFAKQPMSYISIAENMYVGMIKG